MEKGRQPTERAREILMDDAFVKHMTERFLSWRLPENFNPDCGITAQRPNYGPNVKWEPTGTNLLDYTQAEAMVRHMLEGVPNASTPQTSEEVVEAVARAIEALEPFASEGDEYDIGDSLNYRDGWRDDDELADIPMKIRVGDLWRARNVQSDLRAAIAAMPSILQESDTEVTEAMLVAAFQAHEATIGTDNFAAYFTAIYTAMTSARDREQLK